MFTVYGVYNQDMLTIPQEEVADQKKKSKKQTDEDDEDEDTNDSNRFKSIQSKTDTIGGYGRRRYGHSRYFPRYYWYSWRWHNWPFYGGADT